MQKLTKNHIKIEQWELELQQRDGHPVLMADWWYRGLRDYFADEMQLDVISPDYLMTGTAKLYVKTDQKQSILSTLKKEVEQNEEYLQYISDQTLKRAEEFEKVTQDIQQQIPDQLTNQQLIKYWQSLDTALLKLLPWFYIPWYVTEENVLTNKIKEKLTRFQDDFDGKTLAHVIGVLITPKKEMLFQKEQQGFYDLVAYAQSTPNFQGDETFKEKMDNYLQEHSWTNTFVVLPKDHATYEEVLNRVEEALESGWTKEYEDQVRANKQIVEEKHQYFDIIQSDTELVRLVQWAEEFGWLLTFSVEQALRGSARAIQFYKTIADRLGLEQTQWMHLASDEMVALLEGTQSVPDAAELDERHKGYVLLLQNQTPFLVSGESAIKLTDWIENNVGKMDATNTKELSGQPAREGRVTGRVRIVMTPDESYDLEKGEILICSMTSPDYVPAMKRAGAIVTNEGGLLSHAAIVSRELGKPCIVGTKSATDVLNDGDEVEVDADRGVVTIIKKATGK